MIASLGMDGSPCFRHAFLTLFDDDSGLVFDPAGRAYQPTFTGKRLRARGLPFTGHSATGHVDPQPLFKNVQEKVCGSLCFTVPGLRAQVKEWLGKFQSCKSWILAMYQSTYEQAPKP